MRLTILAFIVAVAMGGCGDPMSDTDELRGSVSAAVSEDNSYLAATRDVTTMPAMLVLVDLHAAHIDSIMGNMDDRMTTMQHCTGMPSMMGLGDDVRAETDAHVATMHQAATLPDARSEVQQHVDRMQSMMDGMQRTLDTMHCH